MDSLVTTEWLANEMGASDLRIVDASWHMPASGRNGLEEYLAGHIPGAVFMDLADLVDTASPVDNTLPPPEKFASRMQSLGLGDGSRIVIYDDSAVKTAARAWFMLKLFGAHDVAILDGGIAKWKAEGRPLAEGRETLRHRHFTAWQDEGKVRTKEQMLANVSSGAEQVLDARGAARFTGEEADPRPNIAAGHIPGARNLPYSELFNADGTFKDKAGLAAAFAGAGIDLDKPVVTSCGSGVTACVLLFGMHLLGKEDAKLYDGSWTEWGADPATPKELGAAA
ncbi:3-mercaptopyruvate sulfurtransferase [Novosphingobium sp.]|jgi:thiosulfate/3-mercaptopyruvate sulfurtransferase|uniref:3-mercaptopyruvate sulfurtransferase n=1 Tax=Novosphingobium sp. TaxID=1874826 RepID=UPI0022C20191|nr:3-mercaptopyruvate sulfurtransferase [Novosphingobium sp.]MCZ8019321.1 3-mercaptopyruvate sulfurtransferase [Novosphingobium sp.]MCZ8035136.1 3-mercaptopyruvate sulfurtransferase [Novosphingobium sp.]MCZ8050450.1 3-mercaptopyruvate sulfurtransferase [Novosphingobium sp.]MCZ8058796.1 3-mercaptopyruvate sulfurtransferase [Novosphingobium sp.]MCZ8232241.1 3-mercaptopyruvate sulfurtransferase [Novosphingobium sp.]